MNRYKEIPIFFTIDDGYAPFLAVALHSAIQNADPSRQYKAIVLHQDLSEPNITKLQALQTENFQIELTPMKANFQALDDRMSNRLRCDYFTLTIYFRLFIPAMFPQYDKGIYIDSDVVLTDDIGKLFDIDIGDNLLGACNDLSIADIAPLVAYTENAVGVKKEEYINSGVLLMNMANIRKSGLFRKCRELCRDKKMFMPDQTALNKLAVKRKLPARYNAQGKIKPDTVFKHFTTFFRFFPYFRAVTIKPWDTDRLHNELGIYEFDDILDAYKRSNE